MTQDQIQQLTLLLLYLNSWKEKEYGQTLHLTWKSHDFDTLNKLEEDGLIVQSRTAKSLYLTEDGIVIAKRLESILAAIHFE